jgi:hypothetical protein
MAGFRNRNRWRTLAHKACAVLFLFAYLATAVGFPLRASHDKDSSQPFPCQDHPCGCRSAEDCWRHCCCFSPEERLAWARNNGIEPPPYAEPASAGAWQTTRLRDLAETDVAPEPACSGCAPHGTASSKPCGEGEPKAACCCRSAPTPAKDSRRQSKTGQRWVLVVKALSCRGLSTLWVSGGAVLPPPPVAAWQPWSPPPDRLSNPNAYPCPVPFTPPDPPPRSSKA